MGTRWNRLAGAYHLCFGAEMGERYTPVNPFFLYKGVFVTRTSFRDVKGAARSTWLRVNFKKIKDY